MTISFGKLIANFFKVALEKDIPDFFDDVLLTIKQMIHYDVGNWTVHSKDSGKAYSTAPLSDKDKNTTSPFSPKAVVSAIDTHPLSINRRSTDIKYSARANHMVEVYLHETDTMLHTLVLFREDKANHFTATELDLLENMAPLIWQAYGVCLDINPSAERKYKNYFTAICTPEFELVRAEAGLYLEIDKITPQWNKRILPPKLRLRPGKNIRSYKSYTITTISIGHLLKVELFYVDPLVNSFTKKQFNIAALIVRSHTNKSIASILHLSIKTVERHLHEIYQKLQVSSRTEAISHLSNSNINWNRYLPSRKVAND